MTPSTYLLSPEWEWLIMLLLFSAGGAPERPGPFMFNTNSPMSWGSWAMIVFAPFTLVAFVASLERVRGTSIPVLTPISRALQGNVIWLLIGELLALGVSAY